MAASMMTVVSFWYANSGSDYLVADFAVYIEVVKLDLWHMPLGLLMKAFVAKPLAS